MTPQFKYSSNPALVPQAGCDWASKMVLNPAIVQDPDGSRLHMLFRATGPWPQARKEGCFDPYPIFLGYAYSDDLGETWTADFSRPALIPALKQAQEEIYITNLHGERVRNYANGCIEDPRIFPVDGELYVSVACRMFPPGPYWMLDQDPPIETRYDYIPSWVHEQDTPFHEAARTNNTVTVLFKLDLDKLKSGQYEEAFTYVCPLTDGSRSDNRDVFLFPHKMQIDGKEQFVVLHRPMTPAAFPGGEETVTPSIYIAAAERLEDLATADAKHQLMATSVFDWEANRIGASWPPIAIHTDEWLISYHGKKDAEFGYTQSFMIARNVPGAFPEIIHRCPDRLMYAQQNWELPTDYPTPCLFTTGGIIVGDQLIMAYGAADQKVGISWVNFESLIDHIKCFDAQGGLLTHV
ncbi:putative GH43/DUF377 family glycosyl hydrolase [Paenibacillus endophyticus]|uniref:Putative GH43/DUF377 family glycosyl hydrolase n=1 Tax=Paenibacillus endophyticus TaxID=1294268 RepID=A0A7W5C5K2_9BACL|nr:hypothetical protein [Paenibacillus endophyticus]MBB3150499.1 putative GH43/DUF377 family glycosyl hydrolase [Paenibacillus endophyticus]